MFCGMAFKRWESFRKHYGRFHSDEMNVLEQQDVSLYPEQITDDLNLSENRSNMLQNSHEWDLEWDCTMFLMRITNELSLTHSGIDKMCTATQSFIDLIFNKTFHRVQSRLQSQITLTTELSNDIRTVCNLGDVFNQLSSRYYRESYYCEHFNYVKPQAVCLGDEWEWNVTNGEQKLEMISQYGYYIDLFSSLKGLLSNPAVRQELSYTHESSDDIMRDFCDGVFYKQHPVFSYHRFALQFIIYYDDIEVANPLGSRAGNQKLGCFYFTLANMLLGHPYDV